MAAAWSERGAIAKCGRLCALALCLLAGGSAARAAETGAALPPVADFFRRPVLSKPVLSPGGRYLAAAVASDGGRARLAVIDLENQRESKVVANFNDADVSQYWWVNEQRLVFTVTDLQAGSGEGMAPGLWAVDRDGTGYRQLIKPNYHFLSNRASGISDRALPWHWLLHSALTDGSDDVLVKNHLFGLDHNVSDTALARLNTRTGQKTNLSESSPDHAMAWWVDRGGKPMAVASRYQGRETIRWRNAEGGWDIWQDGNAYGSGRPEPYWFGAHGLVLAVAPTAAGTNALFRVDARTRQLDAEPLVSLKGHDFNGQLVVDTETGQLLGVHFETDAKGTVWLDPAWRAVQAEVDALLPGLVNRIDCQRCGSSPALLVSASSDRQPPIYFIYRRDTKQLTTVAQSRPWIKAPQMGFRDMHQVTARDGLSLPVLVTQPAGKAAAPRPAVVLVHGGPYVRGAHWAWDDEAQFLASRGYVVIEPEFRGSTGYGFAHFRAGWKQWGLAMQDDVADAVRWAVAQGLVDGKRVCIAGASYGGYATLMGLIKDPDLYQCGVNWVGVSDIELMYTINWSDFGEEWKRYGMPNLVGDRVLDAEQLRTTSPLRQAARLKRPLLMAYGGADRRVPIKHGEDFYAEVKTTNTEVEWVVYPEEGHGWRKLENNIDFWTRVEKFLDRHIGTAARLP